MSPFGATDDPTIPPPGPPSDSQYCARRPEVMAMIRMQQKTCLISIADDKLSRHRFLTGKPQEILAVCERRDVERCACAIACLRKACFAEDIVDQHPIVAGLGKLDM